MEIIWKNYHFYEEEIIKQINKSSFISFHFNTTLPSMENIEKIIMQSNNINDISLLNTQKIYSELIGFVKKYTIIQLGLSIFNKIQNDNDKNKNNINSEQKICFDCHSYNIYLFINSKDLKDFGDPDFCIDLQNLFIQLSQDKSENSKIDFNKWIKEGVYYMNNFQYSFLYKKTIFQNINNPNFENFSENENIINKKLNQKDLLKIGEIIDNLKNNFLNIDPSISVNSYLIECLPKFMIYNIKKKLDEENFFYLYFQENFRIKKNWSTIITKYRDEKEKKKLLEEDNIYQIKELDFKKGSKKIFDTITNRKFIFNENNEKESKGIFINDDKNDNKVIVGYDMLLDLMFFEDKFGNDISGGLESFIKRINGQYKEIYDVKYLYNKIKLKKEWVDIFNNNKNNNDIYLIYKILKEKYDKKIGIYLKPNEYLFKDGKYGPGYESFMIGACFLYLNYAINDNNINNNHFFIENKNHLYLMNKIIDLSNMKITDI